MVGPRPEQVVPRLIEPRAIAAVDDASREEVVVALVLDLGDEGVVLRAVVGVVEGEWHRVLVRRVGLAVRVGRHEREVLGDAGAEATVAGALRIAEKHTLAGRELRAVRTARDQHPHHRLAVLSQLHVRMQLGHVACGGHVDNERRRLRRREIVEADQSPVGTRAECEPRHGVGLEHRAQRLRGDDRSRHPAPGHGCRLVRVRWRRRRAQHDSRVPPDDHGRPTGAMVKRVDRELHRPGPRYGCRAAVCEATVQPIRVRVLRHGRERLIVEDERALVAGAACGEVAAREQPAGPDDECLDEGVALGAGPGNGGLDVGAGRRERPPTLDRQPAREARAGAVDCAPDVLGKASGDALPGGESAKRRGPIPQRGAVPVVPGDVERLGVAIEAERPSAFSRHHPESPRRIELLDAVEGRQLEACLPRVRVERQRAGPDHGVIGDLSCGFQVALDGGVLHELHGAEVGEAFAADRVARGVDADLDVHTGEIPDRVRVFGARESADGHPPRIAAV